MAMNPVIKFTTLFGLLAVELGVQLAEQYGLDDEPPAGGGVPPRVGVFVWRSFYGMRIQAAAAGLTKSWRISGPVPRGRFAEVSVSNAWEDASLTLVFGSDYNSRSCAALRTRPGGLSRAA